MMASSANLLSPPDTPVLHPSNSAATMDNLSKIKVIDGVSQVTKVTTSSVRKRRAQQQQSLTPLQWIHWLFCEWPRCAEARRRIRGQERMLIILLLPVLALVALGIREIVNNAAQIADMDRVQRMVSLATDLSGFLDESQVERGTTSVFLTSGGKSFTSNMLTQRRVTDIALKRLYATVSRVGLSDITSKPHFSNMVDYAARLSDIRDAILLLNITADSGVGFYTSMNAEILGCISDISNEVTHSTISRLVMAYWAFAEIKEFAGQERAIGAQGVTLKGWPVFQKMIKFTSVVLTQDTFLGVFKSYAPERYLDQYVLFLGPQEPVVQITVGMRASLLANDSAAIANIDGNYWFYNMTAKLNIMKKYQYYVAQDISASANDVVSGAKLMMAVFGSLFAVIFIFLIQVVRWTLREIKKMAEAEEMALCISEMRLDDVVPMPPRPSPLQAVMYHIVDNLRIYRPYLPDTLFATNEDEDEDEEDDKVEEQPMIPPYASQGADRYRPGKDNAVVPVTASIVSHSTNGAAGGAVATGRRGSTQSSAVSGGISSSAAHTFRGRGASVSASVVAPSEDSAGNRNSTSRKPHTTVMGNAIAKRKRVKCEISERAATVLITDVTGFHQLCSLEQLDDLYGYHTKYITAVEEIVKANKGVVHRFTGDKVFCSWNTVAKSATHSQAACKAALEILRKTKDLPSYSPATASAGAIRAPPSVRISVCSGTMYIGNMGSATIQSYTTVGPLITTAHALNGLNKELGSHILVNANVRKTCVYNYKFRMVDHVMLNGVKATPQGPVIDLLVFELVSELSGHSSEADEEWMYTLQNQQDGSNKDLAFDDGVKAFFQGTFQKAFERFDVHCSSHPDDTVGTKLRKRAQRLAKEKPAVKTQYIRHYVGWEHEGKWEEPGKHDHSSPMTHRTTNKSGDAAADTDDEGNATLAEVQSMTDPSSPLA